MLSILILSKEGEGYEFAARLAQKGNLAKIWIQDSKFEPYSEETVKRVKDYNSHLQAADLILVSRHLGFGLPASVTKGGGLVIGASQFAGLLRQDEGYKKGILKLINEREIPEGLDIELIGWFNGREWIEPYLLNFVDSRFMEGDKGVETGEGMGTTTIYLDKCKLTTKILDALTPILLLQEPFGGFEGCLKCSLVIKDSEVFVKDIDASFDFDSLYGFFESLKVDEGEFLYKLASKKRLLLNLNGRASISVRLSVPPYPYISKDERDEESKDVLNICNGASSHIWLRSLNGCLGFVTSWGMDIVEAKRRTYRTIQNIVKDKKVQYRTDIGMSALREHQSLIQEGWINAFKIQEDKRCISEECVRANS